MSLMKAFSICCIVSSLAVNAAFALDPSVPEGYELVWQDEFNGSALSSTWETWYGMDSYTVGGGTLNMTVYTDPVSGANQGAYIATQNSYRQKYGYFVASVKFDDKLGTSSAFWMLSPSMESNNTDPAVSGTEIDIIEHWQDERNTAHFRVWGPYETGLNVGHDSYIWGGLDNGKYHLIALEWTPTSYKFYVDNRLKWTCTDLISQRSEYLLLDLFPPGEGDFGSLGSADNAHFTVDYVRAYQLPVASRLITGITATASSNESGNVQQLVYYGEDSSKYDSIDNYVLSVNDQWNTDNGVAKEDIWLKFDLGEHYTDIEMDVFNSASSAEGDKRRFVSADIWYALSDPTVDNPTDAAPGNWIKFTDDYAFLEALYDPNTVNPYTTPTLIAMSGVSAQYVLFNDIVNGGETMWGNSYALNTVVFRGEMTTPEPNTLMMLCAVSIGLPTYARKR